MSQTTHKFHKYGKFWGGGSYGLLTLHKFINSDWGWFFLVNLACQWLCAQKRLQISAVSLGIIIPCLSKIKAIWPISANYWHTYSLRFLHDIPICCDEYNPIVGSFFRRTSGSAPLQSRQTWTPETYAVSLGIIWDHPPHFYRILGLIFSEGSEGFETCWQHQAFVSIIYRIVV
jgi:hypothetical protein